MTSCTPSPLLFIAWRVDFLAYHMVTFDILQVHLKKLVSNEGILVKFRSFLEHLARRNNYLCIICFLDLKECLLSLMTRRSMPELKLYIHLVQHQFHSKEQTLHSLVVVGEMHGWKRNWNSQVNPWSFEFPQGYWLCQVEEIVMGRKGLWIIAVICWRTC